MANDNPQLNGIARRGDVMARGPSGWGPVPLSTLLQSEAESVVDANFTIIGSADASKKLKFEVDAQTTGKTATINTGAQTADRTVTLPVLAGNDTLAAVGVANTFSAIQVIDNGSGALPAAVSTNMFRLATVDAAPPRIEIFGFGTTALNLRARISGGTRGSLAAAADGTAFYALSANGYDGSAWADGSAWNMKADGLWSGSNRGTYYEFTGVANGQTSTGLWLRLRNGALVSPIARAKGVTSTATAAGNTTLAFYSATEVQTFTGSTTQTVTFPAANAQGAGIGLCYTINNQSSGIVTAARAGSDTFQGGGTTDLILAGATTSYISDGVSVWLKVSSA